MLLPYDTATMFDYVSMWVYCLDRPANYSDHFPRVEPRPTASDRNPSSLRMPANLKAFPSKAESRKRLDTRNMQ